MIAGKKTRIRALVEADCERLTKWRNDRETQDQLIGWHWPTSVENEQDFLNAIRNDQKSKRFAIETMDGTHIGNIGIYDIDWVSRQCGFGLFLGDKSFRGKGLAYDASYALLDFTFNEVGINRVWVYILETNSPSIKHFERLGFSPEGSLREHNFRGGKFVDVKIMGLEKNEFNNK